MRIQRNTLLVLLAPVRLPIVAAYGQWAIFDTLLAYEMNGRPLGPLHGAPLRLRVENQLGFDMVKWIWAIEFVESHKSFGEGEGGYNEDHEFFGELANIGPGIDATAHLGATGAGIA